MSTRTLIPPLVVQFTMYAPASILVQLQESHAWLIEFLVDLGYHVRLATWASPPALPTILLSDRSLDTEFRREDFAEPLRQAVEQRQVAWISIGSPLPTWFGRVADASLPEAPTGREVTLAVELAVRLVELGRAMQREREECHYWTHLAMHDSLTGLPNRRAWEQRLAQDLAGRTTLALALIDLDQFKRINDDLGHPVGDEVLRTVGQTMRSQLRKSDFLARLGGDEFALIAQNLTANWIPRVLMRLQNAITASLRMAGLPCVTISAGWTALGPHDPRVARDLFTQLSKNLRASRTPAPLQLPPPTSESPKSAPPATHPGRLD